MSVLTRSVIALVVWCCVALAFGPCAASAQTTAAESPRGMITGRVKAGEHGVAGVSVTLMPAETTPRARPVARTTTDADGRYTLTGVPAGRYSIQLFAPVYVVEDEGVSWMRGKLITLTAGETVDGIDFTLTRGGVITGRVTDAAGKPIISQSVEVVKIDEREAGRRPPFVRPRMTDDRGIYRIYGLPAGRYRVSVGEDREGMVRGVGPAGRAHYQRTFYPNVTEEAQARIVEVTEGGEATDIDITIGAGLKTFRVTGRVVDAETNTPVAGVRLMYGALVRENYRGVFNGGQTTDARGEFQLEGFLPGRYVVTANYDAPSESYSEPATFEVRDGDVSGVEIKMRRGTSISGVVILEGTTDRAALAELLRLTLQAYSADQQGAMRPVSGRINPDRSFHMTGLRPGRVRLTMGYPPPKGFSIVRIERGVVAQADGQIDLSAGQPASDVRVVVAYGNATVRGQVKVENGTLPPNAQMFISVRRAGGERTTMFQRPVQVDARGFFLIEGLAAGEYELYLNVFALGAGQRPRYLKQNISVAGSGEMQVTFTLDLSAPPPNPTPVVREAQP